MNMDIFSLLAGLGLGTVGGWIAARERMAARFLAVAAEKARLESDLANAENLRAQMSDHFKALSAEVAKDSQKNFLTLAEESFKRLQENARGDLDKREAAIKTLVDPVSKSLEKMDEKISVLEKARENAYGELREHLRGMRLDQDRLRTETASLSQALRAPSTRGQWGEMQLKRTLEMAGLVEGVHFEQQVTIDAGDGAKQRPDVIVRMPGGKNIVIDSKVPIDAYMDSLKEGLSQPERDAALDRYARHVRDHIKQLSSKAYWEKFDTPDFVVMFLPGEHFLLIAQDRDPNIYNFGFDAGVIPASPATLLSLLRAIAYGWQQEKLAENAREISALGSDLYKRLCTFGGHLDKIGKGISSAVDGYNKAIGSFSTRVLPAARKFQELQQLGSDDTLADMAQIEKLPVAVPEQTEEEGSETQGLLRAQS